MRAGFAIYLIGDGEAAGAIERALSAIPSGTVAFQLRAPGLSGRALFDRAVALRALTRAHGAKLFVNDRLDVALAVGADGAHLPARGLPSKSARRVAPEIAIGCSTHSLPEAKMAQAGGADFVTFGPVWETASHPGQAPLGTERLAEVAGAIAIPVFALGGVTPERAAEVVARGARPACLRAVLGAADPAQAARALLEASRRDGTSG